jgi:hypothetical protein
MPQAGLLAHRGNGRLPVVHGAVFGQNNFPSQF